MRVGARVVAVEPQPGCVREIDALFGGNPRYRCVPKAIGREPGTARLHVPRTSQLSSLKADWVDRWDSAIDVVVVTLDQLIAEFGVPDYCKIDVEGFELDVLMGLSRPIKVVSFEYHIRDGDETLRCLERLARFGDLQINVTPLETMRLMAERWWDYDGFVRYFRDELSRDPINVYGDIYVKCSAAGA